METDFGKPGATASSSFSGSIDGSNSFSNLDGNAVTIDNQGAGSGTVLVDGNSMTSINANGVFATVGTLSAAGTLNLTISNNDPVNSGDDGVHVAANQSSIMCLDVNNNNISVFGKSYDIQVRQLDSSSLSLVGLSSPAAPGDASVVEDFLELINPSTFARVTMSTGIGAGVSCPLP